MGVFKWILLGALGVTIGIILLVAVVLPQAHTGYLYVNNTITTTEMPGGPSIWGIMELLITISFFSAGLGLMGFGIFQEVKHGGKNRKRA